MLRLQGFPKTGMEPIASKEKKQKLEYTLASREYSITMGLAIVQSAATVPTRGETKRHPSQPTAAMQSPENISEGKRKAHSLSPNRVLQKRRKIG